MDKIETKQCLGKLSARGLQMLDLYWSSQTTCTWTWTCIYTFSAMIFSMLLPAYWKLWSSVALREAANSCSFSSCIHIRQLTQAQCHTDTYMYMYVCAHTCTCHMYTHTMLCLFCHCLATKILLVTGWVGLIVRWLNSERGSTANKVHDLDWGAFAHGAQAPQSRSRNCTCVYTYTCTLYMYMLHE